jgi:hypothetical protein
MGHSEQDSGEKKRTYYYYYCKGKYEDDGNGVRRCICHGQFFTLESKICYCPVCNKPLSMIKSETELPEAKTLALEKCLGCKNRQRSAAVNDEHCVGGYKDKDGRIQKVIGSQSCNGCLCAVCCRELSDDINVIKKYGISAVVKANIELRNYARLVLRSGIVDEESEKMFEELKAQDTILGDIQHKTLERWSMDAWNAARKELGCKTTPGKAD